MKQFKQIRWLWPVASAGLLVFVALQMLQSGGLARASAGVADGSSVRIVESAPTYLILEVVVSDFEIENAQAGSQPCQVIRAAGFSQLDQAGLPDLPVQGAMLGIPAAGEPVVTVLAAKKISLPGSFHICPAASPLVETGADGQLTSGGQEMVEDADTYLLQHDFPGSLVERVSTGYVRSQRVAQLRFQPFQYNPGSRGVTYTPSLKVRIDFPASTGTQAIVDEGSFEKLLSTSLLNYEQARPWRQAPACQLCDLDSMDSPGVAAPAYKVSVKQDGIYSMTYSALQAVNVPVNSLDPRTLKIHNRGVELAIQVQGEQDGVFNPSDYVLFYAQGLDEQYTDTNVYWLTWGGANGVRMQQVDGTPGGPATVPTSFQTTQHTEKEAIYQTGRPSGAEKDRWYWDGIQATASPASKTFTTTLQNIVSTGQNIQVRGSLFSLSAAPQHHTRLYLNNNLIDDAFWPVNSEYSFNISVPDSYLVNGTNNFKVEAASGSGIGSQIVLMNWFEIDYRDGYIAENDQLYFDGDAAGTWEFQTTGFTSPNIYLFDITSPQSPSRIINGSVLNVGGYALHAKLTQTGERHYLANTPARWLSPASIVLDTPTNLKASTNQADYLIITHASFYTDTQPLANYRTNQGLTTMVVQVEDVYDEFNHGIVHVDAIRSFLAFAYANWTQPAPEFVLLVGDGNYDPRNFMARGEPSYISPYLADVDPWMGETAADNRFVSIAGSDSLPDMHLGRLPVKTAAEMALMVSRIISYETAPISASWNQNLLFVADNPDVAGDFHSLSDGIADNYLPAPYISNKIYYTPTLTIPATQAAIINAINQGQLMVSYIGHANPAGWATELLFDKNSLTSLTNAQALPFFVPMTCLEGYYITPTEPGKERSALAESLVRASGKGAIASWSPTGFGVASGHDVMQRGLFLALFNDHVTQIGPATTQAKAYLLANSGAHPELFETYLIFGDPALQLRLVGDYLYMPIIRK